MPTGFALWIGISLVARRFTSPFYQRNFCCIRNDSGELFVSYGSEIKLPSG